MTFTRRIVGVIAVAMLAAVPMVGQPPADAPRVRGESDPTRKRLHEAEKKLIDGDAVTAATELQQILDEAGDDLVSGDNRQFQPARREVQRYLARFPTDALQRYCDQADPPAKKLLELGQSQRDPRPLRLLLDRYFVSRPAAEALLLLGELAFERGEFRAAELYWRRLLPDTPPADVPYPKPATDLAAVRARVTLALIFAGDLDRAGRELAILKLEMPNASGRLAGVTGPYVATLERLLAERPTLPPDPTANGDWPTFAGSFPRTGRTSGRLPYYWPIRPTWTTPIPLDGGAPPSRTRPFAAKPKDCAFHPVVLGNRAYLADPLRVLSFDLRTGAATVAYDFRQERSGEHLAVDLALPPSGDTDYTLTVADGKLYARLGFPAISPSIPEAGERAAPTSYLVGLAPDEARPGHLMLLWKLPPPPDPGGVPGVWEGTPIVSGGKLFAALARFQGNRISHSIAAFDDPPGRPLWMTEVSDAVPPSEPRMRPELLSLADGNLVFCSHDGIVSAVDAATGKPTWAFRYPRSVRGSSPGALRDLVPPVADAGRVFVAPADAESVFALDGITGKLLWQAGPMQVDQMLGVTRGRLVVTMLEPTRGVRALNVATGSHRDPEGWACHDDPFLRSFGRGLVTADLVLWPTRSPEGTFLLRASDGSRASGLSLPGANGNLAYADGVLLVATPTELRGYVADRMQVDDRKKAAANRPGDRDLSFALADAGNWPAAEAILTAANDPAELRRRRGEFLTDWAERTVAAGNREAAQKLFLQCVASDVPDSVRVRAAARLAALTEQRGNPSDRLQALGLPPSFAGEWVLAPSGRPVRLREYLADPLAIASGIASDPEFPQRRRPLPQNAILPMTLTAPLVITREVLFPNPRCVPVLPFAGEPDLPGLESDIVDSLRRFVVTDGARLIAYRPGEDRPAWSTPLPANLRITHGTAVGNRLVLAGPRGVLSVRLTDGTLGPEIRLPDTEPLPATGGSLLIRSTNADPLWPDLNSFVLAGSRIVAQVGEHQLIAMDLSAGKVAWVLDSAGKTRLSPFPFPSTPRFSPHFHADARYAEVQLSTGHRWTLSMDSGRVISDDPTALVPWSCPPVRLSDTTIALADGPGIVRNVDVGTGRARWTFDAGGEASLSGQALRLRAEDGSVLVAVVRNHGVEVERIADRSGTRVWKNGPAFLTGTDLDLAACDRLATADDGKGIVYIPANGRLTALRWADGSPSWVVDLVAEAGLAPDAVRWMARAGPRAVIVIPTIPVANDPPAAVLERLIARWWPIPDAGRLPAMALGVYDAWATRTVPILVLDPNTGAVRQKLEVPAVGSVLAVQVGSDSAVIATAGKAYWLGNR